MADKNILLKDGADNLYPITTKGNISDLSTLDVKDLSSGSATNGQVPIANGSGGIIWGSSGGSGSNDVFVATYNTSTYAEVIAALNANKVAIVQCTVSNKERIYVANEWYSSGIIFSWNSDRGVSTVALGSDDTWYPPDSKTLENQANISNNIASFSTSTVRYPSTKAVYDFAVAKSQGSANSGKFLVVGNDGNVAAVTMNQWQGGSY